ncbi:TrkH family potassium uptake protein [Candidatus Nanohalococcus occultus]
MRSKVMLRFVGSFLQVFGALVLLPLLVNIYYQGPEVAAIGFLTSAGTALIMGTALKLYSDAGSPSVSEAMLATVLGWFLATIIGAMPFIPYMTVIDAIFESSAGITTTGISMVAEPSKLPQSVLFWRSFMQWIGGLGILTFFIAVVRESGGASRRLFSAEAHKTDSGSIRPSLTKSVAALWKVYGFMTALIIGTFIAFRVSVFESLLHGFSTISTGGFSTEGASIAAYNSPGLEAFTVLFMFIGGVNFVLLHKFFRSEFSPLWKSSEFRLYTKIFLAVAAVMSLELWMKTSNIGHSVLDGAFQAAAVVSSTGYSTMSFMAFSSAIQLVIVAAMFVGGSLGSTAGGVKVFRLKTLFELLKTRLRAYNLPQTAINEVKIDGEILESSTVRTISVLFFSWIAVVFVSTLLTLVAEDVSLMAAMSGSVSAASNMGPLFLEGEQLRALTPFTKILWSVVMLAGRLEMLPMLAIFNSKLLKDSK